MRQSRQRAQRREAGLTMKFLDNLMRIGMPGASVPGLVFVPASPDSLLKAKLRETIKALIGSGDAGMLGQFGSMIDAGLNMMSDQDAVKLSESIIELGKELAGCMAERSNAIEQSTIAPAGTARVNSGSNRKRKNGAG